VSRDLRNPHREGRLVDVFGRRVRAVEAQLGAGGAQAGAVLRRGVDGDGEDLACRCCWRLEAGTEERKERQAARVFTGVRKGRVTDRP